MENVGGPKGVFRELVKRTPDDPAWYEGGLYHDDEDWGVPAPRTPDGKITSPSDNQFRADGEWRRGPTWRGCGRRRERNRGGCWSFADRHPAPCSAGALLEYCNPWHDAPN